MGPSGVFRHNSNEAVLKKRCVLAYATQIGRVGGAIEEQMRESDPSYRRYGAGGTGRGGAARGRRFLRAAATPGGGSEVVKMIGDELKGAPAVSVTGIGTDHHMRCRCGTRKEEGVRWAAGLVKGRSAEAGWGRLRCMSL